MPVAAKPPITSSEETAAQLCLDYIGDTWEDIATICELASQSIGLSASEQARIYSNWGTAVGNYDADAARGIYLKGLEFSPNSVVLLNGLAWTDWSVAEYQAAAAGFERTLNLHPTQEALAGLASAQYRLGDISGSDAVALLETATALDPNYAWGYREAGSIQYDLSDYSAARAAYQSALDIDEFDVSALYGVAQALSELGQSAEALIYANQAADLSPDWYLVYSLRSFILRGLGRNRAALNDADLAISMAPDFSDGFVQRARSLEALGRRGDAIALLEEKLSQFSDDSFFLIWMVDVVANEGDSDRAYEITDMLASLTTAAQDYRTLAFYAIEAERFEDADAANAICLNTLPNDPYCLLYDAILTVQGGDVNAGVNRFHHAMGKGLAPEDVGYFARKLIALGHFVEAGKVMRRY